MATILVVDDRAVNREVLSALLGYSGHRVTEAANGAEALEQAGRERPDLVIADIVMPVMDGIEFTRRLRQDPSIAATPVIFYTATFRATEARALAQSCGVSIVLPKPSDPQAILDAVNAALDRRELRALPASAPPADELRRRLRKVVELPALKGGELRLSAIVELGMMLATEREPARLLEVVCRGAQDILSARFAAVGVLDDDGQTLLHFFAKDADDGAVPALRGALQPRAGVLGEVISEKRPRRLDGLPGDPQSLGLPPSHPPVHALLAVPIANATRVFGWLYVADKLGAQAFDDLDEELAATLAAQAAVSYDSVVLYDEIQRHAAALQIEVAERRQAQEKLARLSRVRAVMSGVNAAIVRIRDRQELFREACRIAVEDGQFRMAWSGLAIPGMSKVKPVAWTGLEEGYLDEVGLRLKDAADDHGCGGLALKEKRPVIVNNIANDPRVVFKKEALARGYRSLAVFPLLVQGSAVGIFVLHAGQAGFFDQDEVALLEELAADLSFALDYIAKSEEINYLAYYDAMTGLANRSLFLDRLNQAIRLAAENHATSAAIVVDVDRFRFINHTLGRQGGDSVLKFVAERLKEAAEAPERVARVGPDTFALALTRVRGEADIAALLEGTLIPSFSKPLHVSGQELRISVKAGAAVFPGDGTDAETLLSNAEAALEKAKAAGDSYLYYTPQMNERVAEKLTLETRLHGALENEQFVLHYQPKLDLATGSVVGLEALIRWNDPETGLVPPGLFIPLLEETGMILDAGRWIVRQALRDYDRWQAAGLKPPPLAVNVSPIQLRQKDFVATIRDALGERPAGFHGLDLEITESVVMDDIKANIAKLEAIRDMGIRIAIDDFGTGYSSLSYLAKLPVSALKIDRSFISILTDSPDSMSIVSAMISLAHALKLEVIAEGVETEEQRNILRLLKCDQAQGYLFQAPVSSDRVVRILEQQAQSGNRE